jgi:hypothetical protein
MSKLVFIFLDGVGIGKQDHSNPFFLADPVYLKFFEGASRLPNHLHITPIDPLLDTPGIPQSASGQTSLFSGTDVPSVLGKHTGSFPNRKMREILYHCNLLSLLKEKKISGQFINAYPVHDYLFSHEHIHLTPQGKLIFSDIFPSVLRRKISVTTCMMIISQSIPCNERDIVEENALYQDFSNRSLIERGLRLPVFSAPKAGEILYSQSQSYEFLLYEYFQTDWQGHRGTLESCTETVRQLDQMIQSLIDRMDPENQTVLITSDHGNLEDCSRRGHTRNLIPLFAWGRKARKLTAGIKKITDILPAVRQYFDTGRPFK